jgi:hypothetical protein
MPPKFNNGNAVILFIILLPIVIDPFASIFSALIVFENLDLTSLIIILIF